MEYLHIQFNPNFGINIPKLIKIFKIGKEWKFLRVEFISKCDCVAIFEKDKLKLVVKEEDDDFE